MRADEIQQALDDIFDEAVVFHGFTDYMRDYEVIVGAKPGNLRYLFKHCVSAHIQTTVSPQVWAQSLDDRLIDSTNADGLQGYVWGVRWHCLYPAGKVLRPKSAAAQRWSDEVGVEFRDIVIETNAHKLTLICADLAVSRTDRWSGDD